MDAPRVSPARCHIDLTAIRRNFCRLGAAQQCMPVVKSDAYGHGLVPVARTLAAVGAQYFAVGLVAEGLVLRDVGLAQGIVALLGAQERDDWLAARQRDILPAVGDSVALACAAAHADEAHPLRIALQLETGMGRLGFAADDIPALVERLRSMRGVEPALALSHLACADMPTEAAFTADQIRQFTEMSETLRAAFPAMTRSLANSAALVQGLSCGLARPGLALYGGNPLAGTGSAALPELEWAMSVCTPVLSLRHMAAGESISYGRTFTTARPSTVAVVGIGYASGFARALSNRASMLVHGRRVPQVGRICMGLTMLDVTDAGPVRVGDLAWAVGGEAAPGQTPVTPQELADMLGTIPYEVLCLLGGMNERVYHGQ